MKFSIDDDVLRGMFKLGSFIVPENELVFFALRGAQPLEFGGSDFRNAHELLVTPIDYRHMRCTVGQWQTGTGKLAVFVGSSVPHVTAVAAQLSDNGNGVNRLASGYFGKVPGLPDHRYFKGNHGTDRHLAFRNESKLPVWRTSDDTDYEGDDRLEFEVVYDNLHCSRQINETASYYSSYGCVVVAGKEGDSGATSITTELGPWKKFLNNAYRLDQFRFTLAVFEENEALRTAELGYAKRAPTVRFGSRGLLVERLQAGLAGKGYDIGSPAPDGLFGGHTAKALRQFQLDVFGKNGTDLIGGPATAEALGIAWPKNGAELDAVLQPSPGEIPQGDGDPVVSNRTEDEPSTPTGLSPDPNLNIALDTGYKPLAGWQVRKQQGASRWDVLYDASPSPIFLGRFFEYSGYPEGKTRGLARKTADQPRIVYDPADWAEFGKWPELIYPTAWAESTGCFTVINAWDRAAMTFGFIQLAAHTGDDFLPFFRRLFVRSAQRGQALVPGTRRGRWQALLHQGHGLQVAGSQGGAAGRRLQRRLLPWRPHAVLQPGSLPHEPQARPGRASCGGAMADLDDDVAGHARHAGRWLDREREIVADETAPEDAGDAGGAGEISERRRRDEMRPAFGGGRRTASQRIPSPDGAECAAQARSHRSNSPFGLRARRPRPERA